MSLKYASTSHKEDRMTYTKGVHESLMSRDVLSEQTYLHAACHVNGPVSWTVFPLLIFFHSYMKKVNEVSNYNTIKIVNVLSR